MRPQALQTGSISLGRRRLVTAGLLALTWGLRYRVHALAGEAAVVPPLPLRELLLSPQWPWIDPPLPGLVLALAHSTGHATGILLGLELIAATVVVLGILRLGERWLDFDAAVLGAASWAMAAPAVAVFRQPGIEGWIPALAVLLAAAALRVARRRDPRSAWSIGVRAGWLTLFSGGGAAWAVAIVAWLPATSRRFRGREFFRVAGLVALAWTVVVAPVALRNAIVGGGDPQLPLAGAAARLHAAVVQGGIEGARLPAMGPGPATVVWSDSVLVARGLRPQRLREWERAANLMSATLEELGRHPRRWLDGPRRVLAGLGGFVPQELGGTVGIPWEWIVVAAWIGGFALLPGIVQFFPLLLGGGLPLLSASLFGLQESVLLAASPFVCLYAGYGIWRLWVGRRSPVTWLAVPLLVGLALFVRWGFGT